MPWRCSVVKPPLRTKTVGTKVSEEEFAQLEGAASERGLTLSEWCRETLLASVNGQDEKSADSGGTGQALRIAHHHGIAIFNLARPEYVERVSRQCISPTR